MAKKSRPQLRLRYELSTHTRYHTMIHTSKYGKKECISLPRHIPYLVFALCHVHAHNILGSQSLEFRFVITDVVASYMSDDAPSSIVTRLSFQVILGCSFGFHVPVCSYFMVPDSSFTRPINSHVPVFSDF